MSELQIAVIIIAITVLVVYVIDTIGDVMVIRNLKKIVNNDMAKFEEIRKQLEEVVERLEGVNND